LKSYYVSDHVLFQV